MPEILAQYMKAGRHKKLINNLNIYLILSTLQWFEQAGFFKQVFSSDSNPVYCVPSNKGAFFREGVISSLEYVIKFWSTSQLSVQRVLCDHTIYFALFYELFKTIFPLSIP